MIGDSSSLPTADVDFKEIANQIETPLDEGGLKLISYEKEELDKAVEANDKQEDVGRTEAIANILHAVPNFNVTPFISVFSFGGSNLGSAIQAVARANQVVVGNRTFSSTNAGRKASFLRQLQDRVQQGNIAGLEIKSIDKQVLTQKVRISIANQEITNQQKQIDNAAEIEDFLRNKYSNQELYAWMTDQVRGLYYQAYTLAYDLARRAEKVFRFERGLTSSNFIQFGYWGPVYDGLLSGERLFNGLKQLESAYQEKRGYDFEIVKNISLQQIDPLQLIQLRETGQCEVELPEVLFDMGFPGQYMRRVKSVALTFACHVGPPTSINCVLRLREHKFRIDPKVAGNGDYAEHTDEIDPRFSTVNVPITSIAVSTGQNDSGVFELNFRDERYIPFEGAGAISKWRIQLPSDFREFDYDSITDVVMHMRYTTLDGGDKLRKPAEASVKRFVTGLVDLSRTEGLFALFDLRHDFPNEWFKSTQPLVATTDRIIVLDALLDRLPFYSRGKAISAADVYVFTPTATLPGGLTLVVGTDETTLSGGKSVGDLSQFSTKDLGKPMTDWKLKISAPVSKIEAIWLVIRYTIA